MQRRRTVLKTIAGAGLMSASSLGRALGANDRVRVGLIGNGLIGKRHLLDFKAQPDVEIAGVCELSEQRLEEAAAAAGNSPPRYKDFRKLLDQKDVDAVVVSTPDHWHALMTIMACAAGKDVYVEKPVSNGIEPALKMIEAARQHKRVVQVGLQQRSWHHFQEAKQLLAEGYLGSPITHCAMVPPGGWYPRRPAGPRPRGRSRISRGRAVLTPTRRCPRQSGRALRPAGSSR